MNCLLFTVQLWRLNYSLIICKADPLVAQQYCLRTVWHAPACTPVTTINSRCCAVKFSFKHCNDVIVYMPSLNGTCDLDNEYESIVGCMQGIIDNNKCKKKTSVL